MTQIAQKYGWAGRIAQIFLRNQAMSILSISVIIVWGVAGFVFMPKQYNPEITAPAFVITTTLPGASAEDVFINITRPMEDAVREIPTVDRITGQSRIGGMSVVTVRFDIGADPAQSQIALAQKLRDKMLLRPLGASEPLVQSVSPDDVPVLTVALSSETLSPQSLRKAAFDLADHLKVAEGVGTITFVGGATPYTAIDIDLGAARARGVTVNDIVTSLQGVGSGVGVYALTRGETRTPIIVDASMTPDAIGALHIITPRGDAGRLSDIATIAYTTDTTVSDVHTATREKTAPTVFVAIAKQQGSNIMTVTRAITDRLALAKKDIRFDGIEITVARDEGVVTAQEITKLTEDLIKSIVIVGGVLLLLLGARSAFVVVLAIPLVLLAVFGMGALFDQTVNRITLFALILSLGLLVDDAIVVVENIGRFVRGVRDPIMRRTRMAEAVGEVGTALTMATLTMALAFVPMAFVTGMMGPYMGPIPFFVPVALAASLIFAFTITPFLAHIFLGKEQVEKVPRALVLFRRVEDYYARSVRRILVDRRAQRVMLRFVVVSIGVAIVLPLVGIVPFRMLPKADKEQFSILVNNRDTASLSATQAIVTEIERRVLADHAVMRIESAIGAAPVMDFNGLFRGNAARTEPSHATVKVLLTDQGDRTETSEEIATRIRAALADLSKDGVAISIAEDPPGPPVSATLFVNVQGPDEQKRHTITEDLFARIRAIDGTVDEETSEADPVLITTYAVDYAAAIAYGIAPADILAALQSALGGTSVGLMHAHAAEQTLQEQTRIVIRAHAQQRQEHADLARITVRTASGAPIPITRVLRETTSAPETVILSDAQRRTTAIAAEMEGRSVIYAAIDILPIIMSDTFASTHGLKRTEWSLFGVTYQDADGMEYRIMLDGEWKLTLEVFRDLGIVMGIVVFVIYFILTVQTTSFRVPLLIMLSIPLSLVGILPGFAILGFLKGTYFNATSMIGVIALAGLAVKNGIIYMEYVEPLLAKGMPRVDALVEAGRIRLLPITLTSLTAILGSLTIISDPVWEGLAWSLIFGLTASTILIMFVLPVTYVLWMKEENKS